LDVTRLYVAMYLLISTIGKRYDIFSEHSNDKSVLIFYGTVHQITCGNTLLLMKMKYSEVGMRIGLRDRQNKLMHILPCIISNLPC
jgi:hypothetical protein